MLLERCLKSLQKQNFQEFEILLIYSSFPIGLNKILEDCSVIALKETGKTLAAARNLGIRHAKGGIVAFIDDDAEAPVDWLTKIYSTFRRNPSIVCLGGPHLTAREESNKSPLKFVEGVFAESQMTQAANDRTAVGKIAGCNVCYRKIIFDRVGPLNEKLRSGEDWEFHMRLTDNGYSIRFDPAIYVWHHRQGLKHAFWNCANMAQFFFSWRTLRYSRYESFFALFYLSNLLFVTLLIALFISRLAFIFLLFLSLLAHFLFTAVRSKTRSSQLIYYPLSVLFTLSRLMGFYFGLVRWGIEKIKISSNRKLHQHPENNM